MSNIDPEKLTTGQIISSLTIKHWKAAIVTTTAVLAVFASGGYWAGEKVTEARLSTQQGELQGGLTQAQANLTKLETKLESSENLAKQLNSKLLELQAVHEKINSDFLREQDKVASLTNRLGKSSKCDFIHLQIDELQDQIARGPGFILVQETEEHKQKEKQRVDELHRRLEQYISKVDTCDK